MPICHGHHGYFAACGGLTGAAGTTPLHQLGGLRQEVDLRELRRNRAGYEAQWGKAATKDRIVRANARAQANAGKLTPAQVAILRQEHDHRVHLLAQKTITPTDRKTLTTEKTLLARQLKRADRAADLRTQRLVEMQRSAAQLAQHAHDHPSAGARYFADKAAAEVEAYTHREAVTYTHYDGKSEQAVREAFGGTLPRRSQIAAALGLSPGHDITFSTKGGTLFAEVRGPGYSLTAKRGPGPPAVTHDIFRLIRDNAGHVHAHPVATKKARRAQLAELRDRLDALTSHRG